MDECSVIMEIRAASPGNEGARAAGELFRIHRNFWHIDDVVSSKALATVIEAVVAAMPARESSQ